MASIIPILFILIDIPIPAFKSLPRTLIRQRHITTPTKVEYVMVREALLALVAVTSVSACLAQAPSTQPADTKQTPAWEATLKARHDELIQKNGPGTDTALRDQLLKMGAEDQAIRGFEHGKQVSGMTKEMLENLPATDARLTTELQQIVQKTAGLLSRWWESMLRMLRC